jgi:dolichyl-phosphate-mannose-protein mannosyltransferase
VGAERWRWLTGLLLATLAGVMLATFLDYGMTGDEGVQHRYGRKLLRWYAGLGTERPPVAEGDIALYGGFFEIVAETAALVSPLDAFETRHLVNVLFALAAFVAVAGMGAQLAGPRGAFFSALVLALTPTFYGHSFNNPKDIPFAATFALAVWAVLALGQALPRLRWSRLAAAGLAIGVTAGVRVAGIALFGYALALWCGTVLLARDGSEPARTVGRGLARVGSAWAAVVALGWTVMLACWPWAMDDPLRNPLRARQAFADFWSSAVVFFDGRFVLSGEVSRFYLPKWLALVLPEIYLVALAMGGLRLLLLIRERPLPPAVRRKLLQAGWLAALVVLPVTWVVATRTPLYDGMRHFLFVVPVLAVIAGTSVATYLAAARPSMTKWVTSGTLAVSCLVTVMDMVQLHPYQAVYFNRLVAGGLRRALTRYEGDYWCLSFKEGTEWLRGRYAGARCQERIRVAGHSILLQTAYYLQKTEADRALFKPVGVEGRPHFVLATTRYGDHLRTPGRLAHVVERQDATLLYVFETRRPPCE